ELVRADITDKASTTDAVRRFAPDIIVHLAAQTNVEASVRRPEHDADVNIIGTLHVLDAAARAGCRKVVFASSSTVYGDPVRQPVHEVDQLHPISPYGASKLAG